MFSSAQPICQITDFTAENGLPQDIASAVLQDQKGFIWICTRNGLNKFDGYTFKNYKSAPHKEYTLSQQSDNLYFRNRIWRYLVPDV